MSTPETLKTFRLSYLLSIIFGTMPAQLKFASTDVPRTGKPAFKWKFIGFTIVWIVFVSVFLINDIRSTIYLNPTQFFSKKVIDVFPNDFYCIRLLHNIEIWIILVTFIKSSTYLPKIIDDLRSFSRIQPQTELSKSWRKLRDKNRDLMIFYLVITTCPVIYEFVLLYHETSDIDFQRVLQGTLHCVPLTINFQFCSFCMLLCYEFDNLNEHVQENRSIESINVLHVAYSHSTICRLVRLVRRTYEWQLLSETGIITLNVLLHAFHLLNSNDHMLPGYGDVIYSSLWIIHFAGRLLTTCMLASRTISRAKETSKVVLLLEDCYRISNNHEEVTSVVNRIGNQDISFSICGFFHLDGSLIIAVCRWCISFILILLQFRKPT